MFGNLRAKYCPRWWLVGYIHCGPITCPRMSCREWFHPYRGWSVARTSEASTLKCLYIINPALFISQNMVRKACSCTPAHSNNGSILRLAYCIAGTCAWLGTHVVHTRVVPSRDDMFLFQSPDLSSLCSSCYPITTPGRCLHLRPPCPLRATICQLLAEPERHFNQKSFLVPRKIYDRPMHTDTAPSGRMTDDLSLVKFFEMMKQ